MHNNYLTGTSRSCIIAGWEVNLSLEQMQTILIRKGFIVDRLAILKLWVELDSIKES